MGIHSLWTVLDRVKTSKSLLTLAAEHRLSAKSEGIEGRNATLILGVDMGTCMAQCNAGALAAGVNHQWAGAGLYIFFKMLTEYIKAPVSLIFVLDGSARPPFKRGHEVRRQPIWWMSLAIELVEIFGYCTHPAPGEAEAELAKLNCKGYIHGVITSDSDAVLFGTRLLLRSIPKKEREYPDQYIIYAAGAMPLTQGGIILFALLCGGDYSDGIEGCGPTTASALARCGFGDQLLAAFRRLHGDDFDHFLIQWRCAIRAELLTNSRKFLSRCQPNLAAAISGAFPDRRILDLYVNPVTSWSPGPPNLSQWQFKQPSIPAITRFCTQHFHWQNPQIIKQKFKATLWQGIFLQMLYSPLVRYIPERQQLQLPDSIHAEVLTASHQVRRGQFARAYGTEPQPKLVVSTANFVDSMGPGFAGNSSIDQVTVWPSPSLPSQSFYRELKSRRKGSQTKKVYLL
ncbi:PIN domain-like protein [Flammula alnicola]|nr:PIN domain-like protein [Flammula alnicola]KAF8952362.1 PIN domain-like protein [Flammula alnicola]